MFASKDVFLAAPSGYTIARSVRLRSSASAYFNRTPASATNQKTWTWSGWVKRGILGTRQNIFGAATGGSSDTQYLVIAFTASDTISAAAANAGTTQLSYATNAVYRDPSAWYHIVVYFDALNSVFNIYVNNVLQTLTTTTAISNVNYSVNSAVQHNIGKDVRATTNTSYVDGYLTEINFIDGQALTPSSFGTTNALTGVWQPKKYAGTYGTNGFYLNFSSNSTAAALGTDFSGNSNTWTVNNVSVTAGATYDSMTDVPTLTSATVANYCVLNPLFTNQTGIVSTNTGTVTLTNGNLTAAPTTGSIAGSIGTIGVSSGKWYFETTIGTASASGDVYGFITAFTGANTTWIGYRTTGTIYSNGASVSGYATATTGDIIGIALDIGGSTVSCYKNGTLLATTALTNAITDYCYPLIWFRNDPASASANFGQRPFTYTPPSGFVALNTNNLPASTITNGALYMAASTYTGTGSAQTITNGGNNPLGKTFYPDLIWVKSRNNISNHNWTDSVRGAQYDLSSSLTAAEVSDTTTITAINSNGFSVGTNSGSGYQVNASAGTYVAWQWNAGSGSSSSNTNGSITSTVSANTTAGFSVVTYTGTGVLTTVGHGLGAVPNMIILKARNTTGDWQVYTSMTGAGNYLLLDTTAASAASSTKWNNTTPTSSVFSVGVDTTTNMLATTYVAYCFSAVKGFSAFGSYTGNGSTDGPFVYLGFRPRWVMIKESSGTNAGTASWVIFDTSRDIDNTTEYRLFAESSSAEVQTTAVGIDVLSNGFKPRVTNFNINEASGTYIYATFAENPFKNALAR